MHLPGVGGVSLADVAGQHEWQGMVERVTQLTPFTTPIELAQAAAGFATGHKNLPSVVDQLAPFWQQALNAAGLGQHGEPSGLEAFVQGAKEDLPPWRLAERLQKSDEDRAKSIYPRTNTQEEIRLGLGAMTPKSYNEEIGQERAAKTAGTATYRRFDLIRDSRRVGAPDPPPQVLEDLVWAAQLDHEVAAAETWHERFEAVARLFDQRYGTNFSHTKLATEKQAEAAYHELRRHFAPMYAAWRREIDHLIDAQLESASAS